MATLIVEHGRYWGKSIEVGAKLTIGRDPHCNVILLPQQVSRIHATIIWDAAKKQHLIYDGDLTGDRPSRNGILINGVPLDKIAPLRHEDKILISSIRITYLSRTEDTDPSRKTL